MNLTDYTIQIRFKSKTIVNNFIEVGNLLKKVRDKEIFKESFNTFTDYLEQEHPKFSRSFVLRLIQLVEDPKLCSTSNKLGICKTLELLKISDREGREELSQKAEDMTVKEIRTEIKSKTIKRFSSNINEEVSEGDSVEDKCIRQGETLLKELSSLKLRFKYDLTNLKEGIAKWNTFAKRYGNNEKIQTLVSTISRELTSP